MGDKLKPCPFCGGKADYNWGSTSDIGGVSHQNGWVNCTNSNCDASIDVDSIDDNMSDKELIDKWNKRTDDRLQQENMELREHLKNLVDESITLAQFKNDTLRKGICSTDLDEPEWHDYQTIGEAGAYLEGLSKQT